MEFKNLGEFWAFYLKQHSKPATRTWHFCGTALSSLIILAGVLVDGRLLLLAPLVGYGMAWYSHFFVEGNRPATFGHPLWSLLCDYKMFGLILTGRMDEELKRLKLMK